MIKDVSDLAGIPVELDLKNFALKAGGGLTDISPDIRSLEQAKDVLFDYEKATEGELYLMYRGVGTERDNTLLKDFNLRYDLTLLKPVPLGREYNKTVGHYHPDAHGSGFTYPEVYEVIFGKAHYLLQEIEIENSHQIVKSAYLIKASPGNKVVIPPGFGHITINPSLEEPLLMANITADGFSSIYEPIKEMKGGAYFELTDGSWQRNGNYKSVAPLKTVSLYLGEETGLKDDEPMYVSLVNNPDRFGYLTYPQEYSPFWEKIQKGWEAQ